jgi:hypothetical protein
VNAELPPAPENIRRRRQLKKSGDLSTAVVLDRV